MSIPPIYDPKRIPEKPFPAIMTPSCIMKDMSQFFALSLHERLRVSAKAWALEGYAVSPFVVLLYVVKLFLFFAVYWYWLLPWSPTPIHSLERFAAWAVMFEGLGLGCAFGPMAGKYDPPVTACRHFFMVGTIKLPSLPFFLPRTNILTRYLANWGFDVLRSPLDVAVYLSLLGCCLLTMVIGTSSRPIVAGLIYFGFSDRTVYVATRADYYLPILMAFNLASTEQELLLALQLFQIGVWIGAGLSKHGPWFSYVNAVMVSNSFLIRFQSIRKLFYRFDTPPRDDADIGVRLSPLAYIVAVFGTCAELLFPSLLLHDPTRIYGTWLGILFHIYIVINIPIATPTEWNAYVLVHTFICYHNQPMPFGSIQLTPLWGYMFLALLIVPVVGAIYPPAASFLCAFRYYAGNWPTNVYLLKRGSEAKFLENVPTASPNLVQISIAKWFTDDVIYSVVYKGIAFRCMHYFGHALYKTLEIAMESVPGRNMTEKFDQYHWIDGELFAAMVLGHSFGDGYLHDSKLRQIVQELCEFKKGELLHIEFDSCAFLKQNVVPTAVYDSAEQKPLFEGAIDLEPLTQ